MAEELNHAVNGSDGNTSTTMPLSREVKVKLIGYPGPMFAAIQISALTCISISASVSAGLIMYLCGICECTCRRKPSTAKPIKRHGAGNKYSVDGTSGDSHSQRAEVSCDSSTGIVAPKAKPSPGNTMDIRNFWKRNVGERFVLYIAVCDIGFGFSDCFDHAYIYHFIDFPPDSLCAFIGFLLHQFIIGQWFVITTCAVCASSLVVFGKKISLGRYDWRLFAFAVGLPLVVGIFGIPYRMFGASGGWCYLNIGTLNGLHYYMVVTIFQIILFGVVGIAYAAIWYKIRRTTGLMKGSSTERYQNSARLMLILVATFIFQWWSLTFFNIWVLIDGNPPAVLFVMVDILVNFGGVYNCLAYTVIRLRMQEQAKASGANVVVTSDGRKSKRNALDRAPTVSVTSVTMEDTTIAMAATATATADSSIQHQTTRF